MKNTLFILFFLTGSLSAQHVYPPTSGGGGGSGDILNGGNSTGAAITIGTNDDNALNLETNGVPRLSISSGATTGGALTTTNVTANTVTSQDVLILRNNSTGTPGASFGSSILFQGESNTTDNRDMARITSSWSNHVDAAREARIFLQLADNGGALADVLQINRVNSANGALQLGTSSPVILTETALTAATSFGIAAGASTITIGNNTGGILMSNTSTNNITIANSANSSNSTAGIIIGNGTSFTQTSGTRNYVNINHSFAPTSGTAIHNQMSFTGTLNQTGGANGITRSINIAPTITAVADYRALEIAANGANVKGIYQSGATTTNYLVGKTAFGSTTTPTAQVHFAAGTTSAGSSPIKLTSGTNMTTPEAGAIEWDGTNLYVTQTTGPTRKTVAYSGYKVYTALISQTGTSAPTVKVLENTLGGTIVWTRNSTGRYTGTLTGAFTADKTAFFTAPRGTNADAYPFTASFVRINNDTIELFSNDLISGKSDSTLDDTTIEIRVYN